MTEWLTKRRDRNKFPPGEAIFLDVPNTKYPNKYSQGLFFYSDRSGNSSSDLEIFCGVYFKDVTEEIMKDPLGKVLFEDCK